MHNVTEFFFYIHHAVYTYIFQSNLIYQEKTIRSEDELADVKFTHDEEIAFVELEKMCDSGNCDEPPATNKLQLKVKIFLSSIIYQSYILEYEF